MGSIAIKLFSFALRSGIPIWAYGIGLGAIVLSLYGGYRYWKHEIYMTGVEETVKAVEKQNAAASAAAHKVLLDQDACYANGGWWDNTKSECAND